MSQTGIHGAELILTLLLLFVAAFATLARKLETPYPIVLVIAGLLLGFVPGMPKVELQPNVVFVVILPPLLYSAALDTAWEDFRYNLVSIALLAVWSVLACVTLLRDMMPGPWITAALCAIALYFLGAGVMWQTDA